jgi:hypothetical protein
MKKITLIAIALGCGLLFFLNSYADEGMSTQEQPKKGISSIDFLTGYSWGDLDRQGSYDLYPFIVDLNFDLISLAEKLKLRSLLQFQLEPYISYVSHPDSNVEFGNSFFLKVGLLPKTSKIQPYIKVGTGMAYMTQHTQEQGTQFNFISTGALGAHYFFKKNVALTIEGRMRHLSNCGIDSPNSGINNYSVLSGITYQF